MSRSTSTDRPAPAGPGQLGLRSLGLFAAAAVPLYVLFLLLYDSIVSVYSRIVIVVANFGYRALEIPLSLKPAAGPGETTAFVSTTKGVAELVTDNTPEATYLGLILLPALLLATPIAFRKRLIALAQGLALMFVLHVACVMMLFYQLLYVRLGHDSTLSAWLLSLLLNSGQVGTVVLWTLLAGRHWFAQQGSDTPQPPITRSAAGITTPSSEAT